MRKLKYKSFFCIKDDALTKDSSFPWFNIQIIAIILFLCIAEDVVPY